MPKGVRVNLSVPPEMDALLTDLARLTGRSKASWVMEAVEFQLPSWHDRRRVLSTDGEYLEINQCLPSRGGHVAPRIGKRLGRRLDALDRQRRHESPTAPVEEQATPAPQLSRQQRRALERQQRKQGVLA
jgi:hypothetical protein